MPADIFVDPSAATSDVISVGGVCYKSAGPCDTPPNVFDDDIEEGFDDCAPCSAYCPCIDTSCHYLAVLSGISWTGEMDDPRPWTVGIPYAVDDQTINLISEGSDPTTGLCNFSGTCTGTLSGTPVTFGCGLTVETDACGRCAWIFEISGNDGEAFYYFYPGGGLAPGTYHPVNENDNTKCDFFMEDVHSQDFTGTVTIEVGGEGDCTGND